MKPHRRFLYSVSPGQRVLEDAELGCSKRKYHEQNCDHAKHGNSELGRFASRRFAAKLPRFVDIRNSRRDEENSNIDPVGGMTDHAVVGVENNGNQYKSKKNTFQLDAPKFLSLLKEKALNDGVDEHGKE